MINISSNTDHTKKRGNSTGSMVDLENKNGIRRMTGLINIKKLILLYFSNFWLFGDCIKLLS